MSTVFAPLVPRANGGKPRFSDRAHWIGAPGGEKGQWYLFGKAFSLDGAEICSASLLVTSCTVHEAYMNGTLVGRGPVRSYEFDKCYDVLDIAGCLREGRNTLVLLAPQAENPFSYMPHPPDSGVICELVVEQAGEERVVLSSGSGWMARRHASFAADTAGYAIPVGFEEQYDARLEPAGWASPDFDGGDWMPARVIGPAGTAPWTGMHANPMRQMSSDAVYAAELIALELAERPEGRHFRLGPQSAGITVYMTNVHADRPAVLSLRFTTPRPDAVRLDGLDVADDRRIELHAGVNLLCFCQLYYTDLEPELFIQTEAELKFASGLFDGCEWMRYADPGVTLAYPWHERTGDAVAAHADAQALLAARAVADIPERLRAVLQPARVRDTSSLHAVLTQDYRLPSAGWVDGRIARAAPRTRDEQARRCLVRDPRSLCVEGGCAVLEPQEGRRTHFILDFGAEVVGYVQLRLDAPGGTTLDVQCFELIDGDGIEWMPIYNGFRYVCREGEQEFTSHCRRGFRYLSVTVGGFNRPVALRAVRCVQSRYPVREAGAFRCDDERINAIFDCSLQTARLCMLDAYVDCPGHEQAVWVGDARVTGLINLIHFGEWEYDQHYLQTIGQSLCEAFANLYRPGNPRYAEGRSLPVGAFPNYPEGGLPMWSFLWAIHVWEHYLYGGSLDDLSANFTYVAAFMRRCARMTGSRGLLEIPGAWNLIEWGNNDLNPYGETTAGNVLLAHCLRLSSKMAGALGMEALARAYALQAQAIREAVNSHCWDESRRAYVDTVRDRQAYGRYLEYAAKRSLRPMDYEGYLSCARISVQSNTLALLCGCVPEERLEDVRRIAAAGVESGVYVSGAPANRSVGAPSHEEAPGGIVAVGSPFFLFFSLEALYRAGRDELALRVMRRDWGDMLACGTNTCWETFKQNDLHWTRSVAHAWSAAPAVYLPMEALGVRPVEPGYRTFRIEPRASGLAWAKGAVATPFGPIRVQWRRRGDGSVDVQWQAPAECRKI